MRRLVPLLGVLALIAMFLKLPETPNLFGGCKSCSSPSPYLPLIGAAYFALLTAAALLFPNWPKKTVARGGLIWSVGLGVGMTWLSWPVVCVACLIGHTCHVAMWTIWRFVPTQGQTVASVRERVTLMAFAPICVVALFSCLNLTFMAYGFKATRKVNASMLHTGDIAPTFQIATGRGVVSNDDVAKSRVVLNFVTPGCPYCVEQLSILDAVTKELPQGSFHLVSVSPTLSGEVEKYAPGLEWAEDKDGKLRELFRVLGYPTMFVLDSDGKIAEIIPGVPSQLKSHLLENLNKP